MVEKLIGTEIISKRSVVRMNSLNGQSSLTAREKQVLQLAADGFSNKQAAHELNISEDTIDTHNRSIVSKLEASNMKQAVAMGIRKEIIK